MMKGSETSGELRIFLVVIAFVAGFFGRSYYDGRLETNEKLRLAQRVEQLNAELVEAEEKSIGLEAELHSTRIKLEIANFAGKSLESFNFELVCEDYAEAWCEDEIYDRVQDAGESREPDPYEP
jgi:hypothetical protein